MIVIVQNPRDRTRDYLDVLDELEAARLLRTRTMAWSLSSVKRLVKLMEQAGYSTDGLNDIVEGFRKLDLAIPWEVCPWCERRGKTATACHCHGRGWFAKNQMSELQAAHRRADLIDAGARLGMAGTISQLTRRSSPFGDLDDE